MTAVTVTVKDPNGRGVEGQVVELDVTGSDNAVVVTQGPVTDAGGQAVFELRSTRAELKSVTATINPSTSPLGLLQATPVLFTADPLLIDLSRSTFGVTPSEEVEIVSDKANPGIRVANLAVRLVDIHGNPLPGLQVNLAEAQGDQGTAITQTETATDATDTTSVNASANPDRRTQWDRACAVRPSPRDCWSTLYTPWSGRAFRRIV